MLVRIVTVLLLSAVLYPGTVFGLSLGEAINLVAGRLEQKQIKQGLMEGIWPEEVDFTGSIAAGMARAYNVTCNDIYKASSERAGDYIIYSAGGNFFGDEALALTYLSSMSADPCDNPWRKAVSDFYSDVKEQDSTEAYISLFAGIEPSTAVFYIANHLMAAYYVDAEDKQIWRQGLIDWLAQVDDDTSGFPVMALGVATWALALTGPLDDTLIDSDGTGVAYWKTKNLADLPELLLSHQIPGGELYAGSFYWRFDHTNGGSQSETGGYTEDTIFGTLGLVACANDNPDPNLDAAVLGGRQALLGGIDDSNGKVYEHLWLHQGKIYYAYAGEMLLVLSNLIIMGDMDSGGSVNFADFMVFADNWGASDCNACSWCNGADLDKSGEVNSVDFRIFADQWLNGAHE